MENLAKAEIQLLIALIEREEPIETPNNNFYEFSPKSLEAPEAPAAASQSFDPDTWPVNRFLYHVSIPEEEPTP